MVNLRLLANTFLLSFSMLPLMAQELNCRVNVNAEQVQVTERGVFKDMETAFTRFMNNRKWTEDEFEKEERIKCGMIINITDQPSIGSWVATVQILSARPVYNSNYETVLFNFADRDWSFDYVESQPLEYNDNTFLNNITSLLAFYAYIVIGFDYDSFKELGGEPYFQKAWQVVNSAQPSGIIGWDQFNSNRNRYWLAENLINQQMQPLREGYYLYHRQGLDIFEEKPEEARDNMLQCFKNLGLVNSVRPRSIFTITFMDAKTDEIISVFQKGDMQKRRTAYTILTKVDPSRTSELKPMIEDN
ncbi:MAG TPA: DUF4835 family protein [Cyclobacteriaceae bacterium]